MLRCDNAIHYTLRVVGGREVIHRWRQCKRAAVVSLYLPGTRWNGERLCRQHAARLGFLSTGPVKTAPHRRA